MRLWTRSSSCASLTAWRWAASRVHAVFLAPLLVRLPRVLTILDRADQRGHFTITHGASRLFDVVNELAESHRVGGAMSPAIRLGESAKKDGVLLEQPRQFDQISTAMIYERPKRTRIEAIDEHCATVDRIRGSRDLASIPADIEFHGIQRREFMDKGLQMEREVALLAARFEQNLVLAPDPRSSETVFKIRLPCWSLTGRHGRLCAQHTRGDNRVVADERSAAV
jgi:hypothetical protein